MPNRALHLRKKEKGNERPIMPEQQLLQVSGQQRAGGANFVFNEGSDPKSTEELGFMVLLTKLGFSVPINEVTYGSTFAFSGSVVANREADPFGMLTGSCTVVSAERLNDMFCEVYLRMETDGQYDHGIVSASGMMDEIGGHLIVTASGRDFAAFNGGKLTLIFHPSTDTGNEEEALYGLLTFA